MKPLIHLFMLFLFVGSVTAFQATTPELKENSKAFNLKIEKSQATVASVILIKISEIQSVACLVRDETDLNVKTDTKFQFAKATIKKQEINSTILKFRNARDSLRRAMNMQS